MTDKISLNIILDVSTIKNPEERRYLMYKKHFCLKLISLFLSLILLIGFLPRSVPADGPDPGYILTSTSVSDTEDSVDSVNDLADRSGTALIAYAMMKSYVEGYLDDTYGKAHNNRIYLHKLGHTYLCCTHTVQGFPGAS